MRWSIWKWTSRHSDSTTAYPGPGARGRRAFRRRVRSISPLWQCLPEQAYSWCSANEGTHFGKSSSPATCWPAPLSADGSSGWAQWRGPLGTGASPDADPPIHWSETENVRFKVEIPGNSLSSPVVWGDRIYLMSAVSLDEQAFEEARQKAQETMDAGDWPPDVAPVKQRFLVQARSRQDGSLIWERVARESVPHESHYLDSSWSAASPDRRRRAPLRSFRLERNVYLRSRR